MKTRQKTFLTDHFTVRRLSVLGIAAIVIFFGIIFAPFSAGVDRNLRTAEQTASFDLNIVVDGPLGPPSLFGLEKMIAALKDKGYIATRVDSLGSVRSPLAMLVGTLNGSKTVKELKTGGKLPLSEKKESLAVKRLALSGKDILAVAGADDRGLMYVLLDIARQIESRPKGAGLLEQIPETAESPASPVRSMAVFLHSQDDERDWYYSKDYWQEYFGMLAAARWNTFNLVFSHQTPYLAPMYPFHVKVDEYPEVKAKGLTDEQREKNLEMLRYITSLAKDRGLDFTLSVWQQIAWERDSPGRGQESMVTGYNRKNMTDYTYRALGKLLRECPGITGVQLRLNYESGINFDEQTAFFRDGVFRASREAGRPILIEIRDIGLLRETLDAALQTGLPVRVSHKYWAEHMVFPYHPTRFIWTYSYGDWLKYPRVADQIYQVWSLGSHRLFLWGDPEFVRRFAPTTTFEDGAGFEICAPLSQKGFGNAPGAWRIFRDQSREYYRWEFERYWSYYLLFGRLTYNPAAADEVWTRELAKRFGAEAGPAIAEAYRSASQIVSLISGSAMCNYNMGTWPEKDMGGLINYYLNLMPYDKSRFRGFLEYVDDVLAGRSSGRTSPEEIAARLEAISAATEKSLAAAKSLVRGAEKEFWATDMDFRILSGMARYHAQKIRAATNLGFFYRTGDVGRLRQAVRQAETGLSIWKELSSRADQIYSANLVFGPGSVGHWKDNIRFVEDDLKQLKYQEELFRTTQNADFAFDFGPEPLTNTTESWSTIYTNHYMVEPRFRGVSPSSRFDPAVNFGWIEARDLKADPARNISGSVWQGANKNAKELPSEALLGDFIQGTQPAVFRVDLPEGHYQGTVIITDKRAKPVDHGPMTVSVVERFGDRPIIEREVVRAGQTVIKRFNFNMTGERFTTFRLKFSAEPGADFIVNAVLFTRVEPHIAHVPVSAALPGQDVPLSACVTVPPPPNDEHPLTSLGIITSNASTLAFPRNVARVTLKYMTGPAGVSRALEMRASAASDYTATLPAADVKAGTIIYSIEAEDSTGRIVRLPGDGSSVPGFRINVSSDQTPPVVKHAAVAECAPGKPLEIRASVTDASPVGKVLLYYRPTRQTMEYSVVAMDRNGSDYVATIPGTAISTDYDLMYYFEAFDELGNACLYPNPDVSQPYVVVKVRRSASGRISPAKK
jgi:hypothetical protein